MTNAATTTLDAPFLRACRREKTAFTPVWLMEVAELTGAQRLVVGGGAIGCRDPDRARPFGVPRPPVAGEHDIERRSLTDLDAPVERFERGVHLAAEEHLHGLHRGNLDAVHVLEAVLAGAPLVDPEAGVREDRHGRIIALGPGRVEQPLQHPEPGIAEGLRALRHPHLVLGRRPRPRHVQRPAELHSSLSVSMSFRSTSGKRYDVV